MLVLGVILGGSVSERKLLWWMIISRTQHVLIFCTYFIIVHHAAPLRRRMRFVRHEKGWMRRKRLKMERRYLRLQEGVEELKAYIKFKQEYKK